MRFAIIAALLTIPLAACATEPSEAPAADLLILPDVVAYPQPVMTAGADEMKSGYCPVLSSVFMPDYKVMRDQVRAAETMLLDKRFFGFSRK